MKQKNNYFNEIEKTWLLENYRRFGNVTDLVNAFSENFNQKYEYKHVNNFLRVRRLRVRKYSQEQIDFLALNRPNMNLYELVELFNKTFNENKSYQQIKDTCHLYNIYGGRKIPVKKEQAWISWIKENYSKYLTDTHFDKNKMYEKFSQHFKNDTVKQTLFMKYVSQNCDFIFSRKQQAAFFNKDRFPIGFEQIQGNSVYVKVSNDSTGYLANYRKKANVMYEKYHNVMLDDSKDYIVFLNDDRNDFSKDNLFLVSLKDLQVYIPRYKSHKNLALANNKKLRRVALLSIQLENKLKDFAIKNIGGADLK